MTNEEAIKMLKSKMDGSIDTSYEWTECVRLAIKALKEQENPNSIRINFVGEEEAEEFKEYLKNQQSNEFFNFNSEIIKRNDCISREGVIDDIEFYRTNPQHFTIDNLIDDIKDRPSVTPATIWHMIKTRPLTEEEKDEMCLNDNYYTFMYDCKMPDDEQEVLIKTKWGIEKTTYHTDDGCYFEDYEDDGDVIAWMELPEWEG